MENSLAARITSLLVAVVTCSLVHAQTFTNTSVSIPTLTNARAQWFDANNDGRLDLFVSGTNTSGNFHTAVYIHNGDNTFNTIGLTPLTDIAIAFNDYNKDGFLDVFTSGVNAAGDKRTIIYRNNNGSAFVETTFNITNLFKGGVIWNDLDNDGDIDLFISGLTQTNEEKTLLYEYKNDAYELLTDNSFLQVSNGSMQAIDANKDGFPEVVLTGLSTGGTPVSVIYSFDSQLNTTTYNATLESNAFNAITDGDYNEDGFTDIFSAGFFGDVLERKTVLLENNTTNGFVSVNTNLQAVSASSIKTADLNNDGLLDIVLSGIDNDGFKHFKYYQNSATHTFSTINHALPNIYNGDIALGDYDNDGDIDIFQIGNSDISFQANLFVSDQAQNIGNNIPDSPDNLQAIVNNDSIYLYWAASADDLTNPGSLTYNIYVSKQSNGQDLFISPLSDISDGFRRITDHGNATFNNFKFFTGLPEGRYYWSVQAIDNIYRGSNFSPEQSFAVCYPISLGPDTTICYKSILQLQMGTSSDVVNWYSKSNGLLEANSNTLNYQILENDTIIVELTKPYNCTVRDTLIVTMASLPDFNLGSNTSICKGNEFTLAISIPHDSVNWYTIGELLLQDSYQYKYTVNESDTIIAEVFSEYKCVSYDSIIVDVLALPQFDLGGDRQVCFNESTSFDLTGVGTSVSWMTSKNGLVSPSSFLYTHTVTQNDTIIVRVMDANQCVNDDSVVVTVLPLPQINLGNDKSICYNGSAYLQIEGGWNSVKWFNRDLQILASNTNNYQWTVIKTDTVIVEVVDNVNFCVNSDSVIVSVLPLPQFDVGKDTSVCYANQILLQTGSGFQRVDWYSKVDNSIIQSDSWFFNYKVHKSDTLIAKVTSMDNCINYDSIRIEMDPLPAYSIGEDLSVCRNENVRLEVTGNWKQVNWYTEGEIMLEFDNPVYQFTAVDDILIWSEVFSNKACVQYDTIKINVLALPVFDLGEERVYCFGDQVEFNPDVTGSVYAWNNHETVLSNQKNYSFSAARTEKLFLLVKNEQECEFTDSVNVVVNPLPEFTLTGKQEICAHDSLYLSVDFTAFKSITWFKEPDVILYNNETSIRFLPETTSDIFARVEDVNSCVTTKSHHVIINPRPIAMAGADTLLCYGEETLLGGEYNVSDELLFSWYPDDYLNDRNIANPVTSPMSSTTYTLTVTNTKNCTSTDEVYVEVNPKIEVEAGTDKSICIGEDVILGGAPTAQGSKFEYSYQWLSGNETIPGNISNPVTTPLETITYYVLVSSGKCHVEIDSIRITVNALPSITIIDRQSIGAGERVQLSAEGGIHYQWSPSESLDNDESANPVASPLKTTLYTVNVTDQNNCTNKAQVEVLVQNQLFIPTLFTPNGDGSNDIFKLYGSGVERIILNVFDEQGNEVFSAKSLEEAFGSGWDGTDQGKVLKNATYIWTIDGNFFNGEKLTYGGANRGIVKLIR